MQPITPEKVRDDLSRCMHAQRDLQALNERRAYMEAGHRGHGIPTISGGSGVPGDPTAKTGTELADLRREWDAEERDLLDIIHATQELCMGVVKCLGVSQGLVLEYRYIWGLQWKQLPSLLGVSLSKAKAMHSEAVRFIANHGYDSVRRAGRPVREDGPSS